MVDMSEDILNHVIAIAKEVSGLNAVNENTAIDQDLQMSGDDITDFADLIALQYGDDVFKWPWERFAIMGEGLSILFLPMLIWQLITWPLRGTFSYPNDLERLTLGHIAKAIEAGHWIEP